MEKYNNIREGFLKTRPREIQTSAPGNFTEKHIEDNGFSLIVCQADSPQDLREFVREKKDWLNETFERHGALLLRGFKVDSDEAFGHFTRLMSDKLVDYEEPSTPRKKLGDKIYTSTEYPSDQHIPFHNEHSYAKEWPGKVWFYSATVAATGGETPIADSRLVFQRLHPGVQQKFIKLGVKYVRNYHSQLDIPWSDVFHTTDKAVVEAYCNKAGIQYEWLGNEGLRTSWVRPAVAKHPRTHENIWFNQAHLFNSYNLEPEVRAHLIRLYGADNIPRNTYYGDGSPIEPESIEAIRTAYGQSSISFPWQSNDVLMLDNMLYAHSRNSFTGKRKVLVAMAENYGENVTETVDTTDEIANAANNVKRNTAQYFLSRKAPSFSTEEMKYRLAATYRMLFMEGLGEGISGHVSVRIPGKHDQYLISSFGLLADEITPDHIITVDSSGQVLEGDYPVNVAGFCIHSVMHEKRPDINAIVHTHSPWGTIFSALESKLLPLDQNSCTFFENHTRYYQYEGPVNEVTEALNLCRALGTHDSIILNHHGALTCGESLEKATVLMIAMERAFRVNVLALQTGSAKAIEPEIARNTKKWLLNPVAFEIEFEAMLRKVERIYPEFVKYKPGLR